MDIEPTDRLHNAIRAHRAITRELITAAAESMLAHGATPTEVVETLELLRFSTHRELDEYIDDEQTRRPPAGNCFRARRYRELTAPGEV